MPAEPSEPFHFPVSIGPGFELAFGAHSTDATDDHQVVSPSFSLDVGVTRSLVLGARAGWVVGFDDQVDADDDGHEDDTGDQPVAFFLSGGPRIELWTDEQWRQGWRFGIDGGYMWGNGGLADGPVVSIEVAREVGGVSDVGISYDFELGARAMHGLGGARSWGAVLATLGAEADFNVPSPLNMRAPSMRSRLTYTFGADLMYGPAYSDQGKLEGGSLTVVGAHFGIPLGAVVEPRVRAEVMTRAAGGAPEDRPDSLSSYGAFAGARVRLDRWLPLYVESSAGYAAFYGTPAAYVQDGGVLDVGLGGRMGFCSGEDHALELGLHFRHGLGDNEALDSVLFTASVDYAGGRPLLGDQTWWCRALSTPGRVPEAARRSDGGVGSLDEPARPRAMPEAPRTTGPSAPLDEPARPRTMPQARRMTAPSAPVEATARVEIQPPRPVVVEVPLGVVLFGGLVNIDVAPSMLPLDLLRSSGFVEVRIEGPASVIARVEAELRATASRSGVRLSAVLAVPTRSSTVRAVFTIWPAGTRP